MKCSDGILMNAIGVWRVVSHRTTCIIAALNQANLKYNNFVGKGNFYFVLLHIHSFPQYAGMKLITLRDKLSGAVYCYRSCVLSVFVGLLLR